MSKSAVTARIADGVSSIQAGQWDACAGAANPFVSHGFLSILEESNSAVAETGWQLVEHRPVAGPIGLIVADAAG